MADAPALLVFLEAVEYTRFADDIGPDLHLTAWIDEQPPLHVERKQRYGVGAPVKRLLGVLPVDAESFTLHVELEETDTRPELDDRGQSHVALTVPEALRGAAAPRAVLGEAAWTELWGIGGDAGENAIVGARLLFVRAEDGRGAVIALDAEGRPLPDDVELSVGDALTLSHAGRQPAGEQALAVSSPAQLELGPGRRTGDRVERQARVAHAVGEATLRAQVGEHPALTLRIQGDAPPQRFTLSAFGTLWSPRAPVAERNAAFQVGMRLTLAARANLAIVGPEGLKLRRGQDLEGQTRYLVHADVAGDRLGPLAGARPGDAVVIGEERAFVVAVG